MYGMRDYDFSLERSLAKQARARNAWIYNPANKDWFSPKEFEDTFITGGKPVHNEMERAWVKRLVIRDPREYPVEFIIWLEPLVSKAANHAKAVKEWYKEHPDAMKIVR